MGEKHSDELHDKRFITPVYYEDLIQNQITGPNGWLLFAACNSGIDLGKKVRDIYNQRLEESGETKRVPLLNDKAEDGKLTTIFEDKSTRITLPDHVAGSHACVFQPIVDMTSEPHVNDNYMQLFQAIRTLKTHGAKTVTAVLPYLGYSRQDVPTFLKREISGAKLIADLMIASGLDNLWTYHIHANAVKSFYEPKKVVSLSGLDLFISLFDRFKDNPNAVVVSTDAGGAKFTVNYAEKMGIDYAIANKFRDKGAFSSEVLGIIGNFEGKHMAILTDDETVTAGSLLHVSNELHDNPKYGIDEIYIAVSHNKLDPKVIPKLMDAYQNHGLKELHFTNSIPQKSEILNLPFVTQHPLEEVMAYSLNRMHYDRSIRKLFFR